MILLTTITYNHVGPPNIIHINYNTVSLEGSKSKLICIATNDSDSDQPLSIQWYNNNSSDVQVKSDKSRILIYNTLYKDTGQLKAELLFDPVNRTDSGVYTCRAFNDPNCYTEKRAKLTVECKFTYITCIHIFTVVPLF